MKIAHGERRSKEVRLTKSNYQAPEKSLALVLGIINSQTWLMLSKQTCKQRIYLRRIWLIT